MTFSIDLSKVLKIAFIRTYDFPLGGAPQNRALGICRGLIEQGNSVEVHVFAPGRLDESLNKTHSQVYKLVRIYNHSWRWTPFKGKVQQIFGIIEGLLRTFTALVKSHKSVPIDIIFLNFNTNLYVFPFYVLAKIFGAELGRELNEYPQFELYPNKFTAIGRYVRLKTNYLWFDIFLIMTKTLIDFYSPLAKKNAKFLHLPMTVDMDRFPYTVTNLLEAKVITYCGDLSQEKDGVLTLIKAFAIIKNEFPKMQLKLIGNNNDKTYMNKLNTLIDSLAIRNRVILTGFVHPEQMAGHLYASRLLVLSRPDNRQSRGGFPTKLGEYLATGVPVAVTSVGELPNYLTDHKNAFVAKPGSTESFANAMRQALSNDKLSIKVGLAGRKTAMDYFSHSAQGELTMNFLKTNKNKKGQ